LLCGVVTDCIPMTREEQLSLIALLDRRFGDGSLYLRNENDRGLLKRAVGLGLVSVEGYLTVAGKRFVQTGRIDEVPPATGAEPTGYESLDVL